LRQIGAQRDRLAQAGRSARADCNHAIGLELADRLHRAFGNVDRRVHHRTVEHPGHPAAGQGSEIAELGLLPPARQHQRAPDAEPIEFVGQPRNRAGPEYDAHRADLIGE